MAEIKLTKEELDELKKIRVSYNQHTFELGQIEVQIVESVAILEQAKKKKEEILVKYNQLKNSEVELSKKLTEKYGVGTVDIDNGNFTPINQ